LARASTVVESCHHAGSRGPGHRAAGPARGATPLWHRFDLCPTTTGDRPPHLPPQRFSPGAWRHNLCARRLRCGAHGRKEASCAACRKSTSLWTPLIGPHTPGAATAGQPWRRGPRRHRPAGRADCPGSRERQHMPADAHAQPAPSPGFTTAGADTGDSAMLRTHVASRALHALSHSEAKLWASTLTRPKQAHGRKTKIICTIVSSVRSPVPRISLCNTAVTALSERFEPCAAFLRRARQ